MCYSISRINHIVLKIPCYLVVAIIYLFSTDLTAETNTISATADNYIRSDFLYKNSNYGSQLYLRIQDQAASRALVKFSQSDIAAILTPDKVLTSATLQL